GEINVVAIRFPLDREAEQIDVEPFHLVESLHVEREMTEACVRGSLHSARLSSYATQVGRQVALRAVRRERSVGAARRRKVLPRLLGQEDRRRRNRRPRVCPQAIYPRAQRRKIS